MCCFYSDFFVLCLEKRQKKWRERRDSTSWRSPTSVSIADRKVEKRRATRNKVSNPIFFIAKNIGQKEKILTDKAICQSQDLLFTGLLTTFEKGKKWYTRRDSNPRPSTPEADALSS